MEAVISLILKQRELLAEKLSSEVRQKFFSFTFTQITETTPSVKTRLVDRRFFIW